MTFFTTAGLLAFIKWHDSGYGLFKWLCISAFCMGMAIGSKYNALIAWFFINLILMYSYAQDTERQMMALKYGLIFFVISIFVASPWYLKNYLLTQNPFYPLFNSFFQSWHHQPIQEILHSRTIQKTSGVGFLRLSSRLDILYRCFPS
jgi:4-amino-4-deoxy-L-arabinose transferase-like glycosyltransferase